jgi:hypothetical protein
MKTILTLIALLATLTVHAFPGCITNVTIACMNSTRVLINGSTNYSILQTYTNATSLDLMAQDCDTGTVLTFTTDVCPPSDTDICTVSWQCDNHIFCGGGTCSPGSSFTITMPAHTQYMSVRVYSSLGCCTLTKCILYLGNFCNSDQQ